MNKCLIWILLFVLALNPALTYAVDTGSVQVAINQKTRLYHFVKTDSNNNILFDLGQLSPAQQAGGVANLQLAVPSIFNSAQSNTLLYSSINSPLSDPNLQLWLDPYDTSTMTLRPVANLVATGTQLLKRNGDIAGELNFATNNKFSISMWVYFNNAPGDTFADQANLIGKSRVDGSHGLFSLRTGGVGNNHHLNMILYTSGTSGTSQDSTTGPSGSAFASGQWYHICTVFNGAAGANDNQKLKFYVDGTALTTTSGSSLPATLVNDTNQLCLLTLGHSLANTQLTSIKFSDVGVWDNYAFTAGDVTNLYNNGAGVNAGIGPVTNKNQLPVNLQTPSIYWPCNETGGTRYDISGNGYHLLPISTDGSPIKSKNYVINWVDKSGVCGNFAAGDGPASSFQYKRIREPEHDSDGGGPGVAVVAFNNNNCLYNGTANWNFNQTGSIFQNLGYSSFGSASENFDLASSDDSQNSNERLFMTGFVGASGSGTGATGFTSFDVRINDPVSPNLGYSGTSSRTNNIGTTAGSSGSQTTIAGNTYLSTGEIYSREVSCVDDTPAYSSSPTVSTAGPWRYYQNGVQQVVYVNDGGSQRLAPLDGNWTNGWMQTVGGRTNVTLNTFWNSTQQFPTNTGFMYYGDQVSYGPVLTGPQRAARRAWLADRRKPRYTNPKDSTLTGSAYTLTTSAAAVAGGTTSPSVTIDSPGTYRVRAWLQVNFAGMTTTNQTMTFKLRRTNNTAADLTNSSVTLTLPTAAVTVTQSYGTVYLEGDIYRTLGSTDTIVPYANISGALGAGTITISNGRIIADRIQQ